MSKVRKLKIYQLLENTEECYEQILIDYWKDLTKDVIIQKEDNGDIFFYDMKRENIVMHYFQEDNVLLHRYNFLHSNYFKMFHINEIEHVEILSFMLEHIFKIHINYSRIKPNFGTDNKIYEIWLNFKINKNKIFYVNS